MTHFHKLQRAYITVATLSTIPQYTPTIITDVLSRHVKVQDGRKFRKDSREQVGTTEAEKRAGCFIPVIIPAGHPDYEKAADDHHANTLHLNARSALKHWQRHPFSVTAIDLLILHLTHLADFQRERSRP